MKKCLILLSLLLTFGLSAQQMTSYPDVSFDSGTSIPRGCSPPAFYYLTTTSKLYVCTTTTSASAGTFKPNDLSETVAAGWTYNGTTSTAAGNVAVGNTFLNTLTSNQQVFGTTPNLTTVNWSAPLGAVTVTMPNVTGTVCLTSTCPGTVTSVGWTGGIVTVATGTTTPAFTIAGTSGGIPYFSSASTWASTAALTQYGVIVGGGTGSAPTAIAADTVTTHALFATAGAPAFRALALTDLPSGTVQGTGTLNVIPKWSNTTGGLTDSDVTDDGTTVTVKRNTTFANPIASTGFMLVTITPGAVQTSASTTLANGGSETIAGKLNIAGTSLNSALLSVGNVSATNYNGSYYIFGTGSPQTNTGLIRVGILAETNEAVNPSALSISVTGAASNTGRMFLLQTGTEGVDNTGNIILQPFGGAVCIGQYAACTNPLTVSGTASMTTAIITGSSFTFNSKTCTIISTVVTCT